MEVQTQLELNLKNHFHHLCHIQSTVYLSFFNCLVLDNKIIFIFYYYFKGGGGVKENNVKALAGFELMTSRAVADT